ncbi:MAG: HAMP domain-containing histidine kinase [Clostridia bacterium]|nr:HAMP domain-containing histidine kinase [Clostridia bacterium]
MLYLVLFVAFVIGLLWLFQIVWLDDFYRMHKERQVTGAAEAIVSNIDNEDLQLLADRLAAQHDMCILLLDENLKPVISSDDIRFCLIHRMSTRDLRWWCEKAPENGSALLERFSMQPYRIDRYSQRNFRGAVPVADNSQTQNLLCAQRVILPSGQTGYLLLNTQITPLNATVTTLRTQLFMITVVVLLAAMLLSALISRRVSRPIILISQAAQGLAQSRYAPPALRGSYREIDELNSTLTQAAEELNQVEHLQHELIANISHDLRTPLTMIGGYAEAMRDIPDENTPDNMQIIIDETARLSTLVNEILDFSRLQTGSLTMEPAVFCLTDTVRAIVERVSKLTGKDGYVIRFDPEDVLHVTADENRIAQVVYNLLGNALTYTGEDKTVTLTQQPAEGRVRLSIRDTGKGISPEELPLIWNRYYRTKESHRRAVIGSGIGLSIVRSILEQHNAPFGVDSGAEGTTFWFELPLSDEKDA